MLADSVKVAVRKASPGQLPRALSRKMGEIRHWAQRMETLNSGLSAGSFGSVFGRLQALQNAQGGGGVGILGVDFQRHSELAFSRRDVAFARVNQAQVTMQNGQLLALPAELNGLLQLGHG